MTKREKKNSSVLGIISVNVLEQHSTNVQVFRLTGSAWSLPALIPPVRGEQGESWMLGSAQ